MQYDPSITYIGRVRFRKDSRLFGIYQADRLFHSYMIGKTGTGKTTAIESQIMQDIYCGRGTCLIDPHGDLVERIERNFPRWRRRDLIYFNVPDKSLSLKYNPLKKVKYEKRSLVASSILETLSKLWDKAWGTRLEHILRFTLLTLLDQPTATFADIPKLYLEKEFRKQAIQNVINEDVKTFWEKEFPKYMKYDLLPIMNKIGGMLAHPVIKRILIENEEDVSLRKAIDEKKVILVNLSKGHLGEDVSHILGALFITSLGSAAFSRVNIPEEDRVPFHVFIDEFQNFTTLSLINMFSELRKFKLSMTLAHQYLAQLDPEIKQAILGNVGTVTSFRVGTEDAQQMQLEMFPEFDVEDFIKLSNYDIYTKLIIQGRPSNPFSARTSTIHDIYPWIEYD